ncbi:hypothetical protein [Fischerella sp. PCC 9605]|uniref:hypothetical protein n=1 Tax=Fischerella sp. PCC 9605 TaxID=1173024 RepID=UPI00047E48C5|nr:hypothetical protein [Fischerella sp. PCC 9605]
MIDALRKKLSAWALNQLEQIMLSSDEIEMLVRTEKPLSPAQQDELQKRGYRSHYVVGNFSSGSVSNVKQLEEVAELQFVRNIELSFPMSKE